MNRSLILLGALALVASSAAAQAPIPHVVDTSYTTGSCRLSGQTPAGPVEAVNTAEPYVYGDVGVRFRNQDIDAVRLDDLRIQTTAALNGRVTLFGNPIITFKLWVNSMVLLDSPAIPVAPNGNFTGTGSGIVDYGLLTVTTPNGESMIQLTGVSLSSVTVTGTAADLGLDWTVIDAHVVASCNVPIPSGTTLGLTSDFHSQVWRGSQPQVYCTSTPNSTGLPARIGFQGNSSLFSDNFVLTARDCPSRTLGMFLMSTEQAQTPYQGGTLCLGGNVVRISPLLFTDPTGHASERISFWNLPGPLPGVALGQLRYFQFWFRDPAAVGVKGNLTDALQIHVCQYPHP